MRLTQELVLASCLKQLMEKRENEPVVVSSSVLAWFGSVYLSMLHKELYNWI